MEEIKSIRISELKDFKNHPFHVQQDIELCALMKSIEDEGVIVPLLVRPNPDGEGYEVIAGHRRKADAGWAGLAEVPAVIRELDDDQAIVAMVDEGIRSEFIAIVNYGIIGLVQLELGYAETDDMTEERALELYDRYAKQALELMLAKNHDYDEAWRSMRVSSYTDLILMKIYRTKQIEGHDGATLVSEGIDANYMDMINYSVFGLIKLEFGE